MNSSQNDLKNSEKEVKLWGGRFEESVTEIVEKFTESISFDKALYKHDIMGSRAHASMLAHQVLKLISCLGLVNASYCVFSFSYFEILACEVAS